MIEDGSGTNTSYILKLAMRLSVKQTTTVDPIAEMYRTMSGFTQPQLATESAFSDDFTKIIKRRHAATERFMMNPSLSPTTPAKFLKVSLQQHLANHNGTDAGETLRLMRLMAATGKDLGPIQKEKSLSPSTTGFTLLATGDATLDQLSACACDCPVPSRRRMKKSSSPAGCPNYPCLNGGIYFSMNNGRDCGCQCKPGWLTPHCYLSSTI